MSIRFPSGGLRALSVSLASACAIELPFEETQVCAEVRAALAGQVLACTADGAQATAVSDALDAEVPCAVTGFDPDGAALQPGLTTESGEVVDLEAAYGCADTALALSCGETEAKALWGLLVAAAPECAPLREVKADNTALADCAPLSGGHILCETPRSWTEAVAACAAAQRVLWSAEPDTFPEEAWAMGESWLGLSMQTCPDPVECAQMWTWASGGYLSGPSAQPWGAGEPAPTTLGAAVYVTLDRPGGGAVVWYSAEPTELHPFVCQAL